MSTVQLSTSTENSGTNDFLVITDDQTIENMAPCLALFILVNLSIKDLYLEGHFLNQLHYPANVKP